LLPTSYRPTILGIYAGSVLDRYLYRYLERQYTDAVWIPSFMDASFVPEECGL